MSSTNAFKKILIFLVVLIAYVTFHALNSFANAPVITYNIASGDDVVQVNGNCSLTEAIQNVNTSSYTSAPNADCPHRGLNQVIVFVLPSGTITLNQSLPIIKAPVSILGQGAQNSIINGSGLSTSIVVQDDENQGQALNYKDFSVKNIQIEPNQVFDGCLFILKKYATAINFENLAFEDCGGNSLGLAALPGYTNFSTRINNIKVSSPNGDLEPSLDSGIFVYGAYNIEISNVSVTDKPIGIFIWGTGLLSNAESNIQITNTTLYKNIVGLTAYSENNEYGSSNQSLSMINNTIYSNFGYGLGFGANSNTSPNGGDQLEVDLINNIIAGNKLEYNEANQPTFNNCVIGNVLQGDSQGEVNVTSGGNNLTESNCLSVLSANNNDVIYPDLDSSGPLTVTKMSETFGLFGNYGGLVDTLPITSSSRALDAGRPIDNVQYDARGLPRVVGSAIDIGAFELGEGEVIQPDPDPPIPNPIDPILEVKTLPLVARTGVIFSTIIILTTLLGLSFLSLKYLIKKRGGSLSEK
ncbi:MAG: right-handed parallel beta-helix repeat-containing protein [Candidatus Nomurabacteria bacterium]|nr:MAG: right-handed parallel beta-helix repeat-containing protein [Candidatus Nomurabacteria bacterium]